MTLALADLRRAPTAGVVGALFVTVVVVGTVLAPLFTPYDPLALGTGTLLPPSFARPLGTDDLGRDGLARVLYGGRVSLSIGLFSGMSNVLLLPPAKAQVGWFITGITGPIGAAAALKKKDEKLLEGKSTDVAPPEREKPWAR